MKRISLLASVAAFLAFSPTAEAQSFQMDPCSFATFPDRTKLEEYGRLQMKLGSSLRHNGALRELEALGQKFLARKVGNELFALWNDVNRQIQEAVRAPELNEAQVALMDRCLNRLRESHAAETERVRAEIDNFRSLLALPDDEMAAKWKGRLKSMLDAFGTPEAANQTLRINLGLPVPH